MYPWSARPRGRRFFGNFPRGINLCVSFVRSFPRMLGLQTGNLRVCIQRPQRHGLQRPWNDLPDYGLAQWRDTLRLHGIRLAIPHGRLHNPGLDRFRGQRSCRPVQKEGQQYDDPNVNHNTCPHADVASTLRIGQPLLPAGRHADAAAQETPPSGRADLQCVEFDRRLPRHFRRRGEAVGQGVARLPVVRLRAVRAGRCDDRRRREFSHAIRLGDHQRRFRLDHFAVRLRFQSLGNRDLAGRTGLQPVAAFRRLRRIGPCWRRLGQTLTPVSLNSEPAATVDSQQHRPRRRSNSRWGGKCAK